MLNENDKTKSIRFIERPPLFYFLDRLLSFGTQYHKRDYDELNPSYVYGSSEDTLIIIMHGTALPQKRNTHIVDSLLSAHCSELTGWNTVKHKSSQRRRPWLRLRPRPQQRCTSGTLTHGMTYDFCTNEIYFCHEAAVAQLIILHYIASGTRIVRTLLQTK